MTNPINLNQFRKAKQKAEKAKLAEENRIKFGRTKAEKNLAKSKADKAKSDLDGHKREK